MVRAERPQRADDRLVEIRAELARLHEKQHAWNEYVREMTVLPDVGPALSTGRPEMLALMAPRPLSEEECKVLFDMLAVLIETNAALRLHSELVGQLADQQRELIEGALVKTGHLSDYAQFRDPLPQDPDE